MGSEPDNFEKKEPEGDFFDNLGNLVDNAAAVYTGVEYAKEKSKYRPNSNSILDFSDGVSAYKSVRSGTFNENEFKKKPVKIENVNYFDFIVKIILL